MDRIGNENGGCVRFLDRLFLISWQKLLAVFLLWAGSALFIWAVYGPLQSNAFVVDGLASDNVTGIAQDDDGLLWIATWGGGVSRFSGSAWQTLTKADGLGDNRVNALLYDSQGLFWFGTAEGGVSRFDGTSWETFTTAEGLPHNNVLALVEDEEGMIWAGTGDGLSRYDGANWETISTGPDSEGIIVRTIIEDDDGRIWAGTARSGIWLYDGRTFWLTVTAAGGLPTDRVEVIYQDSEGTIWAGTAGGLARLEGQDWPTEEPLGDTTVFSLFEDDKGNLWAGSTDGLWRYDGQNWQVVNIPDDVNAPDIAVIYQGLDGTLWFGGGGVHRYADGQWQNFQANIGLLPLLVFYLGTLIIPLYLVITALYTLARRLPVDRYLTNSKYSLLLIPLFIIAVLLHNFVYALFYPHFLRVGGDEAVFFIVALIGIPLFFLLSLIYTLYKKRLQKPERPL